MIIAQNGKGGGNMDCETKERSREDQSCNQKPVSVSFYCMIENQKNLIEVLKLLDNCKKMTCSNEMISEYNKLIKKIENTYLREAKSEIAIRGGL